MNASSPLSRAIYCYSGEGAGIVFYALLVVPLIVLLGVGFSGLLARLEPWLVLPRLPGVPGWCFVALAVLGIDAVDWLTHLASHRLTVLWRLHAVHHSQEELSILTTYRAHPLVHVSFLFSAVPILAVESNTATPAAVFTVYACLGALPHANVRWTYGRAGRILVSRLIAVSTVRPPGGWISTSAPSSPSGTRSRAGRCSPAGQRTGQSSGPGWPGGPSRSSNLAVGRAWSAPW
jgi:hypothetical protein